MQDGSSYVKDTGDFLKKIKHLGTIPEDAILVTADAVGLYPNIPHDLQSLRKRLNCFRTSFSNNAFRLHLGILRGLRWSSFFNG